MMPSSAVPPAWRPGSPPCGGWKEGQARDSIMIHIILGTKAQLIKMAPVMRLMQDWRVPFNFIFTGQHRETMNELRACFDIKKPDVTLYQGPDITSISAMVFWALHILIKTIINRERIFGKGSEGIVLIHGDTFSTLLGALMAKLSGLKVGHVESGLRSFNYFHPFPEEITRVLTFRLTDFFFCPGEWAMENVRRYAGMKINTIHNTLLDALREAIQRLDNVEVEIPSVKYCVVSIHRFENIHTKAACQRIVDIVEIIAQHLRCIFVLHPVTEKKLRQHGLYESLVHNPQVELRPRYDYFQFIKLVHYSEFMATDGGSNQEECFYMGKPCLLLRQATERTEGLGSNVCLSKFNPEIIAEFVKNYEQWALQEDLLSIQPAAIVTAKVAHLFGTPPGGNML